LGVTKRDPPRDRESEQTPISKTKGSGKPTLSKGRSVVGEEEKTADKERSVLRKTGKRMTLRKSQRR